MVQPSLNAYWQAFCRQYQLGNQAYYGAFAFGMDDKTIDQLAHLVLTDQKRGTTSPKALYTADEPLPYVGAYSIVLNHLNQPVAVIQNTKVEIVPFNQMNQYYATIEGEGDGSFDYWYQTHLKIYTEIFPQYLQRAFNPSDLMIFETFQRIPFIYPNN